MKNFSTTYYSKDFETFNKNGYLYQLINNRILTNVPHRHNFFEIVFILSGHVIQNIDGESKPLKTFQFTVLSPENTHFFEKQSADLEFFSLSVLSENFLKFLTAYHFSPIYGKTYTVKNERLVEEILQLPTKTTNRQKLSVHTIIGDLLAEIIRNHPTYNDIAPNQLHVAIEKIRQPENIIGGIERLAELAGYSRVHLCRLTRAHFGVTPIELLHDIRMHLACEYLESTTLTIEMIAEKIGLLSVSQFHAAFKKYYHCTPYEYRKQHTTLSSIL